MHRIPLALALLALCAVGAHAQSVRGSVSDVESGAPIVGAMVVLLETDGGYVDRYLTDDRGRYALRAVHPGRYQLRVDRIGYASITTDLFDVPVDGTVRDVRVPIQPILLRGIDVSGEKRCEVRPEEGAVTARVWEEARKALSAAAWTQATGVYRYTVLQYVREFDRDGEDVLSESRSFASGSSEAPFEAHPAEELAKGGFVQEEGDLGTVYYAPDAEAFLSDYFLDTHCLGLAQGRDGLVGLAFEPIEGRDLPEIEGVLWIEEETAQLSRLEFSYVNLPRSREIGDAGGEVHFTRLPNGTWIVSDWWIKMPLLERARRGRVRRTGYRAEGGLAWRVSDRDGAIVLEAATASISGSVQDSIVLGPPPDPVRVEVEGLGEQVVTNDDGTFLLPGLPPGLYRLRVRQPALDTLRVAAPPVEVRSEIGQVVHATLQVPTLAGALRSQCNEGPAPTNTAPLFGRVTLEGAPVDGAAVEARWVSDENFAVSGLAVPAGPAGEPWVPWAIRTEGEFTIVKTGTDGRGIFLLCDLPYGSRIRVDVTLPDGRSASRRPDVPVGADVVVVNVTFEEGESR